MAVITIVIEMRMLTILEKEELLLYHTIQPERHIPTICDPEGIYPYESFVETSERQKFWIRDS
jgi:hypothetical protein